ncbi:hypothetical protein [uncultured Legionella sp.]|uniref:mevalonate kinase family protein n=1 Tax=uncultured Legionella sp. TaxID=210934 RepID=UPI0026130344|nr:hypothetical protein [uncultured Legionella sp.]
MKWQIPAKTFLLGEYSAVAEASAIIVTTTPYFELSLSESDSSIEKIHPESPAGILWYKEKPVEKYLSWNDPYKGRGGLGASSAQFLACYWAICHLNNKTPELNSMLDAYYQSSWKGKGLRPSGYDVIAQSHQGCVYINKQNNVINAFSWPFQDISFLILHTGIKLATHHHLMETTLPAPIDYMSNLVDNAKEAFEKKNSIQFINAINDYHHILFSLNLVAPHSQEIINSIREYPEVLAIKGCGALGADTLLIVTKQEDLLLMKKRLEARNYLILATENDIYKTNNENMD